jgi:hypothetical protein
MSCESLAGPTHVSVKASTKSCMFHTYDDSTEVSSHV